MRVGISLLESLSEKARRNWELEPQSVDRKWLQDVVVQGYVQIRQSRSREEQIGQEFVSESGDKPVGSAK